MIGQSGSKSQNSKSLQSLQSLQKEKLIIPQKRHKLFQQMKAKPYELEDVKKLNSTISDYREFYSGTIFQLKCMQMLISVSKETKQSTLKEKNFLYNLCYSESFTTLNECVKQIQSQFQRIVEEKKEEDDQFVDSSSQNIEKLEKCDQKQLFSEILPWNQNKYIQNKEDIKGDFDILLSKTETVNFHQKIRESMKKINSEKIWIYENYNGLQEFKNKERDAIFVFEAKKNIMGKNDASIRDKDEMKKIVLKLKNQLFRKFLEENFLQTRIISVLSQMLKHVIAVRSGEHRNQSQNQRLSFMSYLNEKTQQINSPPKIKPVIMFYLILNNNLEQKKILELLDPFKKILQFWFEKMKVSLTLIGYNNDQKSQEYQQLIKLLDEQKKEHQKEKQREKEEHQKQKKIEKEEHQKQKKIEKEEHQIEKQKMFNLIRQLQDQIKQLKQKQNKN